MNEILLKKWIKMNKNDWKNVWKMNGKGLKKWMKNYWKKWIKIVEKWMEKD